MSLKKCWLHNKMKISFIQMILSVSLKARTHIERRKKGRTCWIVSGVIPPTPLPKVGTHIFLLVRKSKIRIFLGSFRNHKLANFFCVQVRKSQIRKFARKNAVFLIQIHINLPLKYILDYEMPCNSVRKTVQKAKAWKHFKLIFLRRKIMCLRICGSFKANNN